MAYVNPNAPEQQAENAGQLQPIQGTTPTGGAGAAGATGGKAAATPGVNVPAQPSAQLSAYLSANAPQTTQFAQGIAGTVGGQVNAAGAAIPSAVNAYTGQLYSVPTDAALNQAVASSPSSLTPEQQATYKTALDAASKAPNPAAKFEGTQAYQDVTSNVEKAVQTADLWNSGNSIPNLTEALRPFTSPSATGGDRTLDALLVSRTPQAYSTIQGAVAPAANLRGDLSAGVQQAGDALRNAIEADYGATDAALGAGRSYATNLQSFLQNAVDSARAQSKTAGDRLAAHLSEGTLDAQDAALLGITEEQGAQLAAAVKAANDASAAAGMGASPINLRSYLTQRPTDLITAANTASSKDYADVAALQALLGDRAPVLPIGATTADQAGKVPSLNSLDYESALQAAQINKRVGELQADSLRMVEDANKASQGWAYNHWGGLSPNQFNDYISQINRQIDGNNAEIQRLLAGAPKVAGRGQTVEVPGDSGADAEHAIELAQPLQAPAIELFNNTGPEDWATMANPITAPVAFVDPVKSVIGSIGGWLGL